MSTQRTTSAKGWAACLAAIFGGMSLALLQNKLTPVMNVIMDAFHIDMTMAGLLSTIFTVMGVVMALPAAGMLKKFGPKTSGLIAFACAFAGSVLGILTENVSIMLVSRVTEGTGIGIIAVLAPSVISMWFPPEKRGLPMGIWGSWMMVSQTALFFTGTAITDAWGWRGMWILGIAVCVIAAALFAAFVSSPSPEENYADVESDDVTVVAGIKSGPQWILAIAALCYTFCCFTFANWISTYWTEVTPWGASGVGNWVAIFFLVEMIYTWIVGAVLDRFRSKKLVGVVSMVIYGALGVVAFTATSTPAIYVFTFTYTIFEALAVTAIWSIAPDFAKDPRYAGVALGVLNIGLNLGTLLSAPASGAIQQQFGWTGVAVCFCATAVFGAVALAVAKAPGAQSESRVVTKGAKKQSSPIHGESVVQTV